jgi:type I restriction enzyme S subunit
MARVTPDSTFQSAFFFHVMKHAETYLKSQTSGTGIPHVDRELLEAVRVFRPIQNEQIIIAQILDTLDTAIRETEVLIDKLKALKQGLLHDLLTCGIDANGQLRPPQSEASQLYKESPLGWIPREWEVSTVGDCCDIHNNLRLPIASEIREKMQGEYPYYGPTGLLDHINEYRVEGTYTLIGEDGDHFLKFESKPMTQLVSGKFNVNNHAHLLKGRNCLTEWIDVWFRHRDITLYLTRQGAGRFKLNKAGLLNLLIARPSQDEQQAICTTVAQQEARITAEVECRAKLLCHKAGLMDDLLTGRVRVTPLLESVQQPAAHPGA